MRGTAHLNDPSGVARLFLEAVGDYSADNCLTFDEWKNAADAKVGVLMPDGRLASAVATFDDDNNAGDDDDLGYWTASWDHTSSRYIIEPDATDTATEALIANWSGKSRLIKRAGGKVFERNFRRAGESVANYVFRWGVLKTPLGNRGGDDDRWFLKNIGPVEAGALRLAHVCDMGVSSHGYTDEQRAQLIARNTLDEALLLNADKKLEWLNGDIDLLLQLPEFIDAAPLKFVVPGWIPLGVLTLLIGVSQAGKSSLMHHLALLVGTAPEARTGADSGWLDVPASDIDHGVTLLLSGEDPWQIINDRREAIGYSGDLPVKIIEIPPDKKDSDLVTLLDRYRALPNVAMLVVDPARRSLKGSEDESANVDEFLSILGRFAAETGCAVVVLHHLRRNAKPTNPQGVLEAMRGSQAFIDRARCVIAMARRDNVVSIAVVNNNFTPSAGMKTDTRKFRRDANTLKLVVFEGRDNLSEAHVIVGVDADQDVGLIAEAVAGAHKRRELVTRTGRRSICRLPELTGMSRNVARATAKRAVALGAITQTPGGFLVPNGTVELAELPVAAVADAALVNAATLGNGVVNTGISKT